MIGIEFVKQMYAWGCQIEGYVESGAITPDEYKQITGNDYKANSN